MTQPDHNFSTGDAIRFREVQQGLGGAAISTLELETTLAGAINSTVKTFTLTDSSQFPASGYIYIETKPDKDSEGYPVAKQTTFTQSEVIKYTANNTGTGVLSGLTRGSSAPLYGLTPQASTATAHNNLDKVFGSYSITRVTTTQVNPPGVPDTIISNQYTFSLVNAATSATSGGGFPSFAGPVGDRP